MKVDLTVNVDEVLSKLSQIDLTTADGLAIEKSGALVLVNQMRVLVPVDSGATKLSIGQHVVTATPSLIEDEVGPETNYAPNIELGIRERPGYPMQPFVRPAAVVKFQSVISSITQTFMIWIKSRWY